MLGNTDKNKFSITFESPNLSLEFGNYHGKLSLNCRDEYVSKRERYTNDH